MTGFDVGGVAKRAESALAANALGWIDQPGAALDGIVKRVEGALTGNSLVRMATEFSGQSCAALGNIAHAAGFTAAGKALASGRIDDLAYAVDPGVIDLLAKEGMRRLNKAVDALAGKYIEMFRAMDGGDPPPAGEVLLVLGPFPFMVGTAAHQSLKRVNDYRWARQERLNRQPARQFVGVGDERIDLDGYLLPHYTGGADAMAVLRELATAGEPLELMDHFGAAHGRYVVETIEETSSELDIYGQGRRIDFRLALSVYGEDVAPPVESAAGAVVAANDTVLLEARGGPRPAKKKGSGNWDNDDWDKTPSKG